MSDAEVEAESSTSSSSPKKQKNEKEEETKKPPAALNVSELDDEEDMKCIICFDNWTSLGEHCITSLKCGHVYGRACIKRWIETNKCCPTCKVNSQQIDMWNIYPTVLIEGETEGLAEFETRKTTLQEEVSKMQEEVEKLEQALPRLREQELEYMDSLKQLRDQIKSSSASSSQEASKKEISMYKHQVYEVNKDGGCRVLDYCNKSNHLFISTKTKHLFGETYKLQKVDVNRNYGAGSIVTHQKVIRDVKCHASNNWALTVSLDNMMKITDMTSNESVCSYNAEGPLWCGAWDITNSNIVYVGKQQGSLITLDIRNLSESVQVTSVADDLSPVVSVNSVNQSALAPHGAVICCKLNSVWAFKIKSGDYSQHLLPLDGPFMSSSYQRSNEHLLFSARPNAKRAHVRHTVCTLSMSDIGLGCNTIYTFPGSFRQTQLTRSCLFSYKGDYVGAYNEVLRNLSLYSVNSGELAFSLMTHEPVLDICHVDNTTASFLACLSEKKVQLFKLIKDEST